MAGVPTGHGDEAPLTREAVLRAAVAFADATAWRRSRCARLAEQLGVEAMSLYHHVANKEAILDGMVDLVFASSSCRQRTATGARP